MGLITIDELQRASKKYEATLQTLPFMVMEEVTNQLGINLLEVANKDTLVQFQRKGGIAKPYIADNINYTTEIGKAAERTLQVETCVAVLKDHIMNYKEKLVATNDPLAQKVNNQTKKHPMEQLVLESMIRSVAEDIIDAMFFSERDTNNQSPLGMFTGFNPLLDLEIASGEISLSKGNYRATGELLAPADENDFEAYDKIVAFIRSANPQLRKNGILLIPDNALFNVMDALGNKIKYKGSFEFDVFLNHLRGATNTPNLSLRSSIALGSGSRLIYTKPGNFDLGMNTITDKQFVQVRTPYEDPNYVQFWNQFDLGARIRSIHAKEILVNDESNVGIEMSGDYNS
ncbi:MAG: hypothetical protein WCK02_16105 [Bacteroidota bacterium]